jgi:acyl carrier protein
MNQSASLQAINACLSSLLTDVPDDPKINLFETGVLDSLKLLEVVMVLEETFGVFFTPDDLTDQNMSSQGAILQTLLKLQGT